MARRPDEDPTSAPKLARAEEDLTSLPIDEQDVADARRTDGEDLEAFGRGSEAGPPPDAGHEPSTYVGDPFGAASLMREAPRHLLSSPSVKFEGAGVGRHADLTAANAGPAPVETVASGGGTGPDGAEGGGGAQDGGGDTTGGDTSGGDTGGGGGDTGGGAQGGGAQGGGPSPQQAVDDTFDPVVDPLEVDPLDPPEALDGTASPAEADLDGSAGLAEPDGLDLDLG